MATAMRIYKKGDIVDIRERTLFQKERLTSVTVAKLEESAMSPSVLLTLSTIKSRASFLPRELMCLSRLLSTLRAEKNS